VGTVTLGVSIAVPEPYGSLLQERRTGFGDTAAPGIPTHVTLLPPTEVETARVPAFRRHLTRVSTAGRPFRMRLAGTGTFRPVSPVVFVQLAEGMAECAALQEQVRSGPVQRELQFPYHPHVTIAHGIDEDAMDRAFAELSDFAATWTASCFALYEQGADGRWRVLREYPFGTGVTASGVPAQTSSAGTAAASFPQR